MSGGWLLALVAAAWLTIGLGLALLMGRRGHGAWPWLVLGTMLGPLAIALAIDAFRHPVGLEYRVDTGASWGGPVNVLVGVDGSPEADAAAAGVIGILGSRLGRVTLAAVVPYDDGREREEQARRNLIHAARHFGPGSVETDVLSGFPVDALVRFAEEGGYELLAVGTRGAGRAKSLLGSTASRLARGSRVPVLLFGGESAYASAA